MNNGCYYYLFINGEYFTFYKHPDRSIQIIFEYKLSREWIEMCEIENEREYQLNANVQKAIELINKYIRSQVEEEMKKFVVKNPNLFKILNNSIRKYPLDLTAYSISQLTLMNCVQIHEKVEIHTDMNEIVILIKRLLQNFTLFNCRETTMSEQWFDVN